MTTHEVLVKARELIERPDWWCQRSYGSSDGPKCMVGALMYANVATDDGGFERQPGETELELVLGLPEWKITDWNDAPERTHAEVVVAFDRAIAATAPAPDMSWLVEPAAEYLVS